MNAVVHQLRLPATENPLQAIYLVLCQGFGEPFGGTMPLAVFKSILPGSIKGIISLMAIFWIFLQSYKGGV